MLYDRMGRSDDGIREMEEILKDDPDSPEASTSSVTVGPTAGSSSTRPRP